MMKSPVGSTAQLQNTRPLSPRRQTWVWLWIFRTRNAFRLGKSQGRCLVVQRATRQKLRRHPSSVRAKFVSRPLRRAVLQLATLPFRSSSERQRLAPSISKQERQHVVRSGIRTQPAQIRPPERPCCAACRRTYIYSSPRFVSTFACIYV
jgi:hypothetical protein